MKRVLITGGSGFIGRHCLSFLLERGFEVFAITRNQIPKESLPIFWEKLDIAENQKVDAFIQRVKPQFLLHLAWYAKHGLYWNAPENLDCVAQSLHLLKSFAASGGKRVVIAGTCAEYDWKQPVCKEEEIFGKAQGLYGTCKAALHQMAREFSLLQKLSLAWGRIFYLFGPHEQKGRLVPSVISSLLQGKEFICAQGDLERDFLYVEDVAEAFVSLLDSSVEGSVNIASGKEIQIRQMVQWISEKMGAKDLIRFNKNESTPLKMIAEVRRLAEEVHWKPKYELFPALNQTIEWWKNQLCSG